MFLSLDDPRADGDNLCCGRLRERVVGIGETKVRVGKSIRIGGRGGRGGGGGDDRRGRDKNRR